MALKLATTRLGVEFTDAYHRIREVQVSKTSGIDVMLEIYVDSTAAAERDKERFLGGASYHYDYNSENIDPILVECYKLVKAEDDYDGSEDV